MSEEHLKGQDEKDQFSLYKTSDEFLSRVTLGVDTQDSIYKCIDSHLISTNNVEDEYVIVVLKIMNTELYQFYGGEYIVQQWQKKKKLFQTVHNNQPNHFFLQRQRFIYSLKGNSEECQWIYIVSFYQEMYQKIKHPMFDLNNQNGGHELSLYGDAKQIIVINNQKLLWASLKTDEKHTPMGSLGLISRELTSQPGTKGPGVSQQQAFNQSDASFAFGKPEHMNQEHSLIVQENKTKFIKATILNQPFKNILANAQVETFNSGGYTSHEDDESLQFIQILDIGNEGYSRKEINVVVEVADKITVIRVNPIKIKENQVFKISEKLKFDKSQLGLKFQEKIKSIQIFNINDTENIYMMTKEDGSLRLITERDTEKSFATLRTNRPTFLKDKKEQQEDQETQKEQQQEQKEVEENQQENAEDNELEGGVFSNEDVKIFANYCFQRRNFLYIQETNGHIKSLNILECKVEHPFKKMTRQLYPLTEILILDITNHLAFFSDYILANTALILSHGKLLSLYNFKTYQWNHIITELDSDDLSNEKPQQIYFGMPDDEITSLTLNYIFPNSIYDCIVMYKGQYLRRLKYYNEINKTYFEKKLIFKEEQVKQIIKNFDKKVFRKYGDSVARTFFLIKERQSKNTQVWVSENGGKITKFIQNMSDKWSLLNITNVPSDFLSIYQADKKKLVFYSISNVRQCFNGSELIESPYQINEINNFVVNDQTKYFFFKDTLFYTLDGNLIAQTFEKKEGDGKIQSQKQEYNFKNNIKELYMTFKDSIYYKDKKNDFRYANLSIQNNFDIESLPTKVLRCSGAFVQKIDFCVHSNRLALFTSPFEIKIIPNLNQFSIDLMATMNFEDNFIFWKQYEQKVIAFKEPNIQITWDLDSGKVLQTSVQKDLNVRGYQKHSEWNGLVLLKQEKSSVIQQSTQITFKENMTAEKKEDIQNESKALQQYPHKHIFYQLSLDETGKATEICKFIYDYKPGLNVFVSFPYVLAMDENCTKMYLLEGKGIFKSLKHLGSFYETQMKIGQPAYFSPDFMHRIFIDTDTKNVILNYSLTNQDLIIIPIQKKKLMFQQKDTHPMIYFHDNENIVIVNNAGVEKLFKIEKTKGRWKNKTTVSLKEIAYIYYNKNPFVRRFIYDQLNMNKQLIPSLKPLNILRLKFDLLRRGIILNEYKTVKIMEEDEEVEKNMKREYIDKNVGDFSNLIVGNFRRQMSFSYLTWKIIEQIDAGNLSLLDFNKEFVQLLSFTILPDQTTFLHNLSNNYEELQNFIKILASQNKTPQIDTAHNEDIKVKKDKETIAFNDIPFLPDLKGQTPLHISLAKHNTRFTDKVVTSLATTDFDHHIRFILPIFKELIDQVPQALKVYLESREKVPIWIENYTRGKIVTYPDCEFMMASNKLWDNHIEDKLEVSLFKGDLDLPLQMFIIDLPNMQKYENKYADELMKVLSETDNIQLFEPAAIRAIVELKWPKVYSAMYKYLFLPYLCLLFFFLIYSVFIFENLQQASVLSQFTSSTGLTDSTTGELIVPVEQTFWEMLKSPEFWIQNQKQIFKLVMLSITTYFFTLEFRQFVVQGPLKYFSSAWNLIDMIPLTLITLSLLLEYFVDFPQTERAINAVSAFFLWVKFLYFLRMNRPSSKFISMIVAVIADMKVFLLVLVVGMVSFSQSMYILSNNNNEEKQFIGSMVESVLFTYEIALGSWDVTNLGETDQFLIMTLFVLSTLFLQVMMLNMLIAVISDTYAQVEEQSTNQVYKNMADLIVENEYLVPSKDIIEHDSQGDYLYIAKVDENLSQEDQLASKLDKLKRVVKTRSKQVYSVAQVMSKGLNETIHSNTEKYVTAYIEEALKHDLKFKSDSKRLNVGSVQTGARTFGDSALKDDESVKPGQQKQSPTQRPQSKKAAKAPSLQEGIFVVKEQEDEDERK